MSILSLYSLTLAAGDAASSNSPALRFVDWKRSLAGIAVSNPRSEAIQVQPGVEKLVFDGSRSTSIDGTTVFSLALSPIVGDVYRFTFTAGTDPVLRTARAVDLTGIVQTLTALGNGSLLVAAAAGTPFAQLQVGDEVFIPGPLTGDVSTVFNAINQGRWVVLGVGGSGATTTLVRPAGQDFQGLSEVVTPAAAAQFLGYSASGVQPGDKMDVSAGFAIPAQRTYSVVTVTSKWLEVQSSVPVAAETGIHPTAAGMQFFTGGKRFLRIEADQECAIRLNGDTGITQRLSPWIAGDPEQVAEYMKVGPAWGLKVFNKSSQVLNLNIISCE